MNPEGNNRQKFVRRVAIGGVALIFACGMAFYLYTDQAKEAQAVCGCGIEETDSCSTADCSAAGSFVDTAHDDIEDHTNEEFDLDLEAFEDWLIEDFLNDQIAPAMAMMTNQMNAVAMQYTQIIGSFMDAKLQMETQRLYQKLRVDAHRDYHISEDFCWFGTNSRSLSGSASKGAHNAFSLGQIAIKRQLGSSNLGGSQRAEYDLSSRWQKFVRTYCDYHDSNWRLELTSLGVVGGTLQNLAGTNMPSGLELACDHDGNASGTATGATNPERMNRDIDYTRLMEEPRTLEVDFTDQTLTTSSSFAGIAGLTGHEEDIIEMSNNLYGHNVLTRSLSRKALGDNNNNAADGSPQTAKNLYLMLRSVAAKRSVAQSSFSAIVGLKSSGTSLESLEGAISGSPISAIGVIWQTQRFMAAIMEDVFDPSQTGPTSLGEYIFEIMGLSPSYYSQLEILSKRIYQNPDFYSNLYDSSANVARKKVAMRAIELMVDREIYESQLRREMIVSVLLSSKLRPSFREANAGVSDSKGSRK